MKSTLFSKYNRFMITLFLVLTVFIAVILFSVLSESGRSDQRSFYLSLKEDRNTKIYPFIKGDNCYLFIPSGFSISDFELCQNNQIIERDLSAYKGKEEILFSGNPVRLFEIEDLPSLFIDVTIGDIEEVNSDTDKETQARARINIYDENAERLLNGHAKIWGRGNTSWLYYDKKPYNITLDEGIEILGMSKSRKWCLLSNSTEKYPIENELVYDFAGKLDFEYTPECRYVNVYINGEYNGLYLLAERIDVEKERLDLDHHRSYLLETDLNQRLRKGMNCFISEGNNIFEVKFPETISKARLETIQNEIQHFEDALIDLNSDEWKKLIDMDSWARVYLLDELFENVDGGYHSIFFYKNEEGLYVRGPIWDYDRSFAYDTDVILCGNENKFANQISITYNYYLLQREEFRNRVLEILNEEFLPLINDGLYNAIQEREGLIYSSNIANQIRWKDEIDEGDNADEMMEYIFERSRFISDYYSNVNDFCKVQIEDLSSAYYLNNYVIRKGGKISDIDGLNPDLLKNDLFDKETGKLFDADETIDKDICLVRRLDYEETIPHTDVVFEEKEIGFLNILMVIGFIILFGFAIYLFMKRFVDGKV